jgi:4'-phosphopantetheinyl transferase EntD
VIEAILPAAVAAEEAFGDPADAVLLPAEEVVVARAVAKRRAAFTTARHCARGALRRLGQPPVAILPGDRGAPQWPAGIVGSITHCDGYRAAALARADDLVTIGIDAEPDEPLPDGVLDAIALPSERAAVARLAASAPGVSWDRLLFSAKESIYKAWFPLAGKMLDFSEAEVMIDPVARSFAGRLLVPGPVAAGRRHQQFAGSFVTGRGLVMTAIGVPA